MKCTLKEAKPKLYQLFPNTVQESAEGLARVHEPLPLLILLLLCMVCQTLAFYFPKNELLGTYLCPKLYPNQTLLYNSSLTCISLDSLVF